MKTKGNWCGLWNWVKTDEFSMELPLKPKVTLTLKYIYSFTDIKGAFIDQHPH